MRKLLLLLFICTVSFAGAQPAWHLIKDKNNIQVYTATSDSTRLKHIKVVALLNGTVEKVIPVFLDVPRQKDWVYATKKAYIIKKITDTELLYYVETSLPWPISNRDIAIRMKILPNKNNNILTITTVGEPGAIPGNKGLVRVPQFTGNWTFTPAGNNKIKIEYFLFVDPGGSLPAWIVNMFIGKGPYETFNKLADLLK